MRNRVIAKNSTILAAIVINLTLFGQTMNLKYLMNTTLGNKLHSKNIMSLPEEIFSKKIRKEYKV